MCAALLCAAAAALAADVPLAPILRIETGKHTEAITSIAASANGKILLTGSYDKTVRVWAWDEYRQARWVLRPPITTGSEGKILAVALSADGEIAAVGGDTGQAFGSERSVYLFDTQTGAMRGRIGGLPGRVINLRFTPGPGPGKDPILLAVTESGLARLYRLPDGTQLGPDMKDCSAGSSGGDVAEDRRVVLSCHDGKVRLYDGAQAPSEVDVVGGSMRLGRRLGAARFRRDGKMIAVGSKEQPALAVIQIVDGGMGKSQLIELRRVEGNVLRGGLESLVWTHDGRLCAGGRARDASDRPVIRCWSAQLGDEVNKPLEILGHIEELAALPQGLVAFAASEPAWGIVSQDDRQARIIRGDVIRFRSPTVDRRDGLMLSADGLIVGFASKGYKGAMAYFNAATLSFAEHAELLPQPAEAGGARLPGKADGGVAWQVEVEPEPPPRSRRRQERARRQEPVFKEVAAALPPGEKARSTALAHDGARVLVGTTRALRLYQRDGGLAWMSAIPAPVFVVRLSKNGRLAVAALGDGTIRWYNAEQGQELLALYINPDLERWIAWTPSGYYDASPGGEGLMGWHVNRGHDEASELRSPDVHWQRYLQAPKVVRAVLHTGSEKGALEEAGEGRGRALVLEDLRKLVPPRVRLLDRRGQELQGPQSVSAEVIRVRAHLTFPPGAPPQRMRVFLDHILYRNVPVHAPTKESSELFQEVDVRMPGRNVLLSIKAETAHATGREASAQLRWTGAPRRPRKPNLHALVVGVSKYPQAALPYPAKDAHDVATVLREQEGYRYQAVEVKEVLDRKATRAGILEGLSWLRGRASAEDVSVIFMAGHGSSDDKGQYFFRTVDGDDARISETMLMGAEIKQQLQDIPGQVLVFVDTCRSGGMLRGTLWRVDQARGLSDPDHGVMVLAASMPGQPALEKEEWGNGAFTKVLVAGLRGKASTDGVSVTMSMLEGYVGREVFKLTGGKQVPVTVKPDAVPDLVVADIMKGPPGGEKKSIPALVASHQPAPVKKPPANRRWWLWATLGVVAAGAAVGLGVGLSQQPAQPMPMFPNYVDLR